MKISILKNLLPRLLQKQKVTSAAATTVAQALSLQMERLSSSRSASTMQNYLTATRSFLKFAGQELTLGQVDTVLLEAYSLWLRRGGVCPNTISCYMRSLRSLLLPCHQPIEQAFAPIFRGSMRTQKRSIPIETISCLRNLKLEQGSFMELARDVFLFSFYAMGMPFVDVAHLKRSQIAHDYIEYFRQKTGQRVVVPIVPQMLEIVQRHQNKAQVDYVFPLLHTGSDKEYMVALGRYNRALHRLARLAGLSCQLTSYVVRHTWASVAYATNIDLPVISKALGHTNAQTTLTYIREIDDQRLANAIHRVIDLLDENP